MIIDTEIQPDSVQIGTSCSLCLTVRSDQLLETGCVLEVQFPNSWLAFNGPSFTRELQTQDPDAPHYITVASSANNTDFRVEIAKRNYPYVQGWVRHGRVIRATLTKGTIPAGVPIQLSYCNTFAPWLAGTEPIWIRIDDKQPDTLPTVRVLPGTATRIRLIAPSAVHRGEPFDVLIASLDEEDNRSCTRYEHKTITDADGNVLAENLHFTGTLRVPVTLNDTGIHRVRMDEVVSNAIRVVPQCQQLLGPYWGDIHIHSQLSHDGYGQNPYGYSRDVAGLDFAALADHWESLGREGRQHMIHWAHTEERKGRFVPLLGIERNPTVLQGHHNIYFRNEEAFASFLDDKGEIFSSADPESRYANDDHWRDLDREDAMLIPHHTGIVFGDYTEGQKGAAIDWKATQDHDLRPLMEIYSHHGQSELYCPQHALSYEVNRMRRPSRRANTSAPGPYYAQDYWKQGVRVGVIASSDEHSGRGGRPSTGLAAVMTDTLNRDAIFNALRERRCYATTGERILLEFSVDETSMGQSTSRSPDDTVEVKLRVWGTAILLRVEILRYRFDQDDEFVTIKSIAPKPEGLDAAVEVTEEITGPCVYYARVTQEPMNVPEMAWSSPVWVDVN